MSFLSGRTSLTTVQTADIADNSVTLAKMASGTDGNLIGFDASGNPAAIATGTDGQVLTSGGAGVAASMETLAGADVVLIATNTPSAATTSSFTEFDSGTYSGYLFKYHLLVGTASGSTLAIRTSTNGGSSYDASSGNYYTAWTGTNSAAGAVQANSETLTYICLVNDADWGGTGGESVDGYCILNHPDDATAYTRVFGQSGYSDDQAGTNEAVINFMGSRMSAADVDAIQFYGNNSFSGTIEMFGYK